jgi:hypothetical protein
MSGLFGGSPDIPSVQASPMATKTAERVEDLTADGRRKKRQAASILTRDWGKPKLSEQGMLGM